MKTIAKNILRKNPLPIPLQEKLLFLGKCGYWPNFEEPRSFNEKINWRKLNSTNGLYVTCCDKLAVRDHVRKKIGKEFLIPLLYVGDSISPRKLHSLGDDIVVKANHDSGSVFVIRKNTPDKAAEVSRKINRKLAVDYGKETREWWYSQVKPQIYVEKFLECEEGTVPFDVKFFVFRGRNGEGPRTVIEVDHNRGLPTHHRTFYDENGEVLFFGEQAILLDTEPNHEVPFPCPDHLEALREVAFKLSEDFDHVRVDLYLVDGHIYFGELTLSDGGGRSRWTPREFDFHMGELWDLNREPGGSECPDSEPEIVEQEYVRQDPVRRLKWELTQRLCRVRSNLGVRFSRLLRFFALPYAIVKMVNWSECNRNFIRVCFDHLYIFFVLKYFPDNYTSCRLYEKPLSELKYYYGRGYDPLAIAKRNRHVRRPECAVLFEDKEVSHALCHSFMLPQPHLYGTLDPGDDLSAFLERIFAGAGARKVYIKPVDGDGGRGTCIARREKGHIVVRQVTDPDRRIPCDNFRLTLRSVLQEGVDQHSALSEIYPEALNTVRIATLLTPEMEIIVVGAILRIGTGGNFVDNGGQGGLASLIDLETGQLGPAATDYVGRPLTTHPDSGFSFNSFQVPCWEDTLELARDVQRHLGPFNRFIGMDIGISETGPVLIEVNDIFGSGLFEAVAGPMLKDEEVRRCLSDYEMITHNKFN